MKKLKAECKSADLLLQAIEKLAASLDSPYEPLPLDPSVEYCNAALNAVFFCKCVLRELVASEKHDLRGTGGLRLAISLGDIESTQTLFRNEIEEIVAEYPAYEAEFVAEIREVMTQMKLGEDWLTILPQEAP